MLWMSAIRGAFMLDRFYSTAFMQRALRRRSQSLPMVSDKSFWRRRFVALTGILVFRFWPVRVLTGGFLMLLLLIGLLAHGWPRRHYSEAEIVSRAELIVIAKLR